VVERYRRTNSTRLVLLGYGRGVNRPTLELASTLAYIPVSKGNRLGIVRNCKDCEPSAWLSVPAAFATRLFAKSASQKEDDTRPIQLTICKQLRHLQLQKEARSGHNAEQKNMQNVLLFIRKESLQHIVVLGSVLNTLLNMQDRVYQIRSWYV
jgi:hypothetical protein